MEERIQKILARAGLGSRRACEDFITAGRVTVNGQVASLGEKADLEVDRILVDGQTLKTPGEYVYIAIYKPRGVLSTVSAPDSRPTVRDLVDLPGRFYPVGRLDVDSEGLILLTNDGELANRLTHPRYGHEKEYRVLVAVRPDEEQLAAWRRGVVLEDGYRTKPAIIQLESTSGKGAWLRVILREGRKRQIRETGSRLGLPVVKIIRVRIGSLELGSLKPREWRLLSASETEKLRGEASSSSRQVKKTHTSPKKTESHPTSSRSSSRPRKSSGTTHTSKTRPSSQNNSRGKGSNQKK
jgi:23S rRNA pseudouridine2605 synthase